MDSLIFFALAMGLCNRFGGGQEIFVIFCLLMGHALSQFKKFCLFLRIYLHIRHIL